MLLGCRYLQRIVERVNRRFTASVGLFASGPFAVCRGVTKLPVCAVNWPSSMLVALLLCGWTSSIAQAQLRSGRTTRPLYVDETPSRSHSDRQAAVAQSSGRKQGPSVISASFDEWSTDEGDVPCDYCGDSAIAAQQAFEPSYDSHSIGLCDSCDCGDASCSSCGSYSDLAPTCTSMACSPGRGPLMSLWCRMSVRAEVPLYWRRAMGPPALVTTAPSGTAADQAGELGQSTTQTLLGGVNKLDDLATAGVRFSFSTWLGSEQRYALMFRYWNAGTQNDNYNFSSNQFPVLARPFLDTSVTPAVQNTQLVAFPGDSIGNISVEAESKVDGLELTLKRMIYQDRFTRVDWLYGYQHVSIDESLSIFSNTTVTGNVPGLQGNSIAVRDNFRTSNDFNGMAYGLMSSRQIACWKMETMFRLGLGNLRRKVNINGTTTTTANGNSLSNSQGLLARNTNDNPLVDDTFVVVPEVGINFACLIRPGLDFTVGYNYMLVPKVAQASEQINDNLAVNLSDPLTGALDPSLNLRERKYWINSLGLGLQLRY